MTLFYNLILLFGLFGILGIIANYTVDSIKYLGYTLKIKLFFLGIILGLMTSLPELFVGINATLEGSAPISVGNLISGIIVMLTLILGSSLIVQRKIITDGKFTTLIPITILILSPILFGLNGSYDTLEGLMMVILYIALIVYMVKINHHNFSSLPSLLNRNKTSKALLVAISGTIGIIVTSHWIVKIALTLLQNSNLNELMIGTLIFGVGTNLPEIVVAITSWHKKSSALSLSHLLSSSFSNVLILGILVIIRPIDFRLSSTFLLLALFLPVTMFTFLTLYRSGKKMDRKEGVILVSIYVVFVLLNVLVIEMGW
jgi:cation:H+ antiporter